MCTRTPACFCFFCGFVRHLGPVAYCSYCPIMRAQGWEKKSVQGKPMGDTSELNLEAGNYINAIMFSYFLFVLMELYFFLIIHKHLMAIMHRQGHCWHRKMWSSFVRFAEDGATENLLFLLRSVAGEIISAFINWLADLVLNVWVIRIKFFLLNCVLCGYSILFVVHFHSIIIRCVFLPIEFALLEPKQLYMLEWVSYRHCTPGAAALWGGRRCQSSKIVWII